MSDLIAMEYLDQRTSIASGASFRYTDVGVAGGLTVSRLRPRGGPVR